MKATLPSGVLQIIPDCYIDIPGAGRIELNNLPKISDSKSANYNPLPIIGRSFPLYTYSHSADRTIGITLHFYIVRPGDAAENLQKLRWIQSAVYPRVDASGAPFIPPAICQIKCGDLLASEPICAILKDYSVEFPEEAAWDETSGTFCPFKFDVQTNWFAVYTSDDLPNADRIVISGR